MSRRQQSNQPFTSIGDVLSEILRGYRRKSRSDLSRVCLVWDSIAGATIAANSRPVAMKGKKLTVIVTNSNWLQHLQFHKSQLIDGINRQVNDALVEDIRFKIGTF